MPIFHITVFSNFHIKIPHFQIYENAVKSKTLLNTNVFLLFDKYYDDGKTPTEMNFNLIRVYGNDESLANEGLSSNANVAYSMNINLSNN